MGTSQSQQQLSEEDTKEWCKLLIDSSSWREEFTDSCGGHNWKDLWFLDGIKAVVTNDEEKMTIDTTRGVGIFATLWTNTSFSGDLKIEYDFKRGDSNVNSDSVNVIYIQATGKNCDGYDSDIKLWADKRTHSAMPDYYANMHTYHISYATERQSYVRGRRYNPEKWALSEFLKILGTELEGELHNVEIFRDPSVWIHVTILKRSRDLFIEFQHSSKTVSCHMRNTDKPPIEMGRIGLRLMPGRISHFKNFKVFVK